MSWKPEVKVVGDDNWYDNALRFATREEAERRAKDLMHKWTTTTACRATESDDPVNYALDADGKLVPIDGGKF